MVADPGDVIHIHSPGGGGRGDPFEREAERVLEDVERGYVSAAAAERDYGVVIRDGGIDRDATSAARKARANPGNGGFYDYGPERDHFEKVWTHEAYDALSRILSALPAHWRFFVKTKVFDIVAEGAGHAPPDVAAAWREARRRFPAIPEVEIV